MQESGGARQNPAVLAGTKVTPRVAVWPLRRAQICATTHMWSKISKIDQTVLILYSMQHRTTYCGMSGTPCFYSSIEPLKALEDSVFA